MYKIAICDDVKAELDGIEEILMLYSQKRDVSFSIKRFQKAEVMLKSIYNEEYVPDLIVCDIFLKKMSGVDAVEKLRGNGFDIPVIFLTMSSEHALEAYNLDVLQYLLKPLDKDKFFHALDISFSHIEKIEKDKEEYLIMKMSEGVCKIFPDHIIYCETKKNYQVFHMEPSDLRIRKTSIEIFEILKRFPQFMKCGTSYILNLNHVIKVNKEKVYFDNGESIFLPRNKVAEFKSTYFDYYCNDSDE